MYIQFLFFIQISLIEISSPNLKAKVLILAQDGSKESKYPEHSRFAVSQLTSGDQRADLLRCPRPVHSN